MMSVFERQVLDNCSNGAKTHPHEQPSDSTSQRLHFPETKLRHTFR